MYAIHTTDGFILDSRTYGDADKLITIFTRDFGLITATALSIRKEASKLRYFCQDYSFGRFSLVRGKEFWRLTSAMAPQGGAVDGVEGVTVGGVSSTVGYSTKNSSIIQPSADLLIARLAQLLRRLLHGEEANPSLYEVIEATADFLAGDTVLTDDDFKALESITVLRVLAQLGYIGADSVIEPYSGAANLTLDLIHSAAKHRTLINLHINKALKESHL